MDGRRTFRKFSREYSYSGYREPAYLVAYLDGSNKEDWVTGIVLTVVRVSRDFKAWFRVFAHT